MPSLLPLPQRYNEVFLRRSLKTLLVYAALETELAESTFPDQVGQFGFSVGMWCVCRDCSPSLQVRLLAHNLNQILSNTMKLQQYEDVSQYTLSN